MSEPRKEKPVVIYLSLEEYEKLREAARREGFSDVSEFLKSIAMGAVKDRGKHPGGVPGASQEALEYLGRRIERVVFDLLNPFTGKIDEISRKVSQVIEYLEAAREIPGPQPQARARREPRARREELPASVERLRKEKVVFGEDLTWLRRPELFFEKLARYGAKIVRAGGETIAVDKNHWEVFEALVRSIEAEDSKAAAKTVEEVLGDRSRRLFEKLVESDLAFYDEEYGAWVVTA